MITCIDATMQIGPIKFYQGGRRNEADATETEVGQLRSVVGSLGWIARRCRPDVSYIASKGQGSVCKATIKDLKEANGALQ